MINVKELTSELDLFIATLMIIFTFLENLIKLMQNYTQFLSRIKFGILLGLTLLVLFQRPLEKIDTL